MQKPTVTEKVKNVLGVGHGHTHGTTVGGPTHAGTHTGTHPGVVQQVENAVTGHGTHGTHSTGLGPGTGLGAGTGLGPQAHHTTGTTGVGHTGVLGQVENAVTGHGTHTTGTHVPGTHTTGTHVPGTHTTGTHVPGTHTTGTHVPGTHTTGTHASGPAGLLAKAKLKVTGHT